MAQMSKAPSIVESGVNAGMSGFLFRQALPDAEVWHIDPLSKPICDPGLRSRWMDTGTCHYLVGPSDSVFYENSAGNFLNSDGADAAEVAKHYGSQGFRDFFEVNWSNTSFDKDGGFVFFDNHVVDFDNIIKGVALGFKSFLIDDNYRPPDGGDMNGQSIKQVLYRGGGQAFNLASVLDFYYEFPPIINPLLMSTKLRSKYPGIHKELENALESNGMYVFQPSDSSFFPEPLLNLDDPDDLKLFEAAAVIVPHWEFAWYNHIAVLGKYRNGP